MLLTGTAAAALGPVMLGVVGTAALVAGLAWVFARWYARPKRRRAGQTPADYGLDFAPASIDSGTSRLAAWLVPSALGAGRPGPVVVIAHGWSSNKASMLPVAAALHRAGTHTLLFDARGHGASAGDGPITIRKFAEDIVAAINFVQNDIRADIRQLGLLGHSIGGGAAIVVAATDPRVRCVVSCSAFAHPFTLTRRVMQRLHLPRGPFLWGVCRILEGWLDAKMDAYAPALRIAEVKVPALLLHGTRDRYVTPSDMAVIASGAVPGHTERVLIDGRRHTDILADDEWLVRSTSFLTHHLGSRHERPRRGHEATCAGAVTLASGGTGG